MNIEINFLKDLTIRGCFTYRGEIVIRGYDRFYNLNEIPLLTWKNLEQLSQFKASVKENGCIIFISAVDDQLLVTSKRSIGKHALKGREWLLKSIEKAGKSLEELVFFLKGITMVCELVDQDFEDHILDYPRNKWGLYLHGINLNSHHFESWEIEKVEKVAHEFGMFPLQTFVFQRSQELKEFLQDLDKTGTFNGQEIEGFVIRTRTLDNKHLFFKYKFKKPYLMYREFRHVTSHILDPVQKIGLKIEFYETYKYMTWVHAKLKKDSNYFNGFLEHNGIIRARKEFLMENLVDSEYLYKEMFYSNNKEELGKILILPISIVGSGKTTFGKLIKSVCPVQMAIVQSDNMPKRNTANHFIAGIMEAFKTNSIVFADKNNHLAQHRQTICQKFREKYTNGYVLALDWQVEKYDRLEVLEFCKKRILERGENHQNLTPNRVPKFEAVIRSFLSNRDPLDRTKSADYAIDKVLHMNLFDDSFTNLERFCKELSWNIPENWDDLLLKVKEEKEEFKLSSAKKIKARYYAIHIMDDILSVLDLSFQNRPQDFEFWKNAKERIATDRIFHVTLGVKNVHKPEYSFYDKNHVALQDKKIDVYMTRVVWDENAITIQVKLPNDIKCGNQYPHITIATLKDSVESRYSNELLASAQANHFEIQDETVYGKITPFY